MKKTKAFTLAEVLTTLTVIGIVAAIVIPSLITDINDKAFDTQRKALYARFSQAIPLMDKIAGYGTLSNSADTAAETLVADGLSKVIKMNNVCYSDNLSDCNFPETFMAANGTTSITLNNIKTLATYNALFSGANYNESQQDTKAAAFETANGESILVYYNPNCVADLKETTTHNSLTRMCINLVYDLNGSKAPNTAGKDIGFISVLYSSDPVIVAPVPLASNLSAAQKQTDAASECKKYDSESRVPNKDELTAMVYNRTLLGITTGTYWSSTAITSGAGGNAWALDFSSASRAATVKTTATNVRCVKR